MEKRAFTRIDEELQTPFQTQSTKNALQVLALDQSKTFLDALKPVDGLDANFDARFFENPFFDRPVKEQVAADSSRYERKLEFQKTFFKEQFERAKSGDPKYLNALLVRGIVPQPFDLYESLLQELYTTLPEAEEISMEMKFY